MCFQNKGMVSEQLSPPLGLLREEEDDNFFPFLPLLILSPPLIPL